MGCTFCQQARGLWMIKTACLEFGSSGIRFKILALGPIANRMMESLHQQVNTEIPEQVEDFVKAMIPMNRYGTNSEITQMELIQRSHNLHFSWLRTNPLSATMGFFWQMEVSLLDDWTGQVFEFED